MARNFYIELNEDIPAIAFKESCPEGFEEITDNPTLIKLYTKKYLQRKEDGKMCYSDFQAELYMMIKLGQATEEEVFAMEDHIKDVKSNIITGDWATASNINAGLSLQGIYTQEMKDAMQDLLDTYIANNY